jgi:hypothetical protein
VIASESQRSRHTGSPGSAPASATARHTRRVALRSSAFALALVLPLSGAAALTLAGPAAAAPAAPSGAAAPAAAPGIVSVRPEHPSQANPTYFALTAEPGATLHDAVVIANDSNDPVSLTVTPVDGLTGQTSGSVYGNRTDPVRKAGGWVKPELKALTLGAHESRTVGFTISVPAGTAAGDHLAGIAVENTEASTSSNGFPIKQILRSVVGVLVDVPGGRPFTPVLKSASISGIGATGVGAVDITLANSGQKLGKPTLTVALNGPGGYTKTETRELDTVLPGDTIAYPFAWPDKLSPGAYSITAVLSGGGQKASLTRSVQLGQALSGVNTKTAAATTSSGQPVWVWALIAAGAAVLFALVLGLVIRRGSGRPPGGGRRGPGGPGAGSGGGRGPLLRSGQSSGRTPVGAGQAGNTFLPAQDADDSSIPSTGHLRPGWQA